MLELCCCSHREGGCAAFCAGEANHPPCLVRCVQVTAPICQHGTLTPGSLLSRLNRRGYGLRGSSRCGFAIYIDFVFFLSRWRWSNRSLVFSFFKRPGVFHTVQFWLASVSVEWGGILAWSELVTWPHKSSQPNLKVTFITAAIYLYMDVSEKPAHGSAEHCSHILEQWSPTLALPGPV